MIRLVNCCVVLSLVSRLIAAEPESSIPAHDIRAVQTGVERTIAWLARDMQVWREEHGCAACHHGPMYLWAVSVAKRQGYDINETQFAEVSRWLLTDDEARIFPKSAEAVKKGSTNSNDADRIAAAMRGHRKLSQPTIYLTHALNALPVHEPLREAGWKMVIDHLRRQRLGRAGIDSMRCTS